MEDIDRLSTRKVYKDRRNEFINMTPEEVEDKLKDTQTAIAQVKENLKIDPVNQTFLDQKKELCNLQTRIYSRLKKLGINKGDIRSRLAEAKKKPVSPPKI